MRAPRRRFRKPASSACIQDASSAMPRAFHVVACLVEKAQKARREASRHAQVLVLFLRKSLQQATEFASPAQVCPPGG